MGRYARKKQHKGDKPMKAKYRTKRKTKDLDEIHDDLKPAKYEKLLNQDIDLDKPGAAQYYCIHCAKYFISESALKDHFKGKPHKRRLKAMELEPYTQAEAERAAGMGSYVAPKKLTMKTQLDRDQMDESGDRYLLEVFTVHCTENLVAGKGCCGCTAAGAHIHGYHCLSHRDNRNISFELDTPQWDQQLESSIECYVSNGVRNTRNPRVTFNKAFNRGRIYVGDAKNGLKTRTFRKTKSKCNVFLYTRFILDSSSFKPVYGGIFSLDIEGDELKVLQTIPFDKVNIKMMAMEYVYETRGLSYLKNYVEKQGYDSLLQVSRWDVRVNDIIFRKKGLSH